MSHSLTARSPSLRLLPSRRSVPLRAELRASQPTVQSTFPSSSRKSVRVSAVAAPKEGAQVSTSAATDARSAEVGGSGAERAAEAEASAVVLLDVREMMCGGCAAAVRQVLSEHPRVISAGVNLVTESAAVTVSLRAPEASASASASASTSAAPSATAAFPPANAKAGDAAAELEALRAELAELVEDAGFPCSVRRVGEADEEAEARRKEAAERRQRAVARARVDVAVAGVLAALCCAHHVGHLLHGMGLHALAHGPWMAVLDDVRARSAIAAVALLGPARDLLLDGMKALLRRSPNMNSLVGLASLAAFFIAVAAQLYPDLGLDSSFTDEPVMLLAVVLLGRSLEASARAQASSDLNALMSLLPSTARLLVQDDSAGGSEQGEGAEAGGSTKGLLASLSASGVGSGGVSEGGGRGVESGSEEEGGEGLALSMAAWVQVPANHVRPGDRVLVLPGDVIPVDGVVESGRSAVDESLQTGEAATVPKRRGAAVAAGTVNWEGPIVVSATATGASCGVCEMARRVEDAQQRTAPVQRLADAIAGPFVFTIMSLSAATFAFWYTVGVHLYPAVLLSDFAGDVSDPLVLSLRLAISVLVVACPCALGLATPTAILVGTSLDPACVHGRCEERAAAAWGRLAAVNVVFCVDSEHASHNLIHMDACVRAWQGRGGDCCCAGETCWKDWPQSMWWRLTSEEEKGGAAEEGRSVDGGILGCICVSDSLRAEAQETVSRLESLGVSAAVLSGDRQAAVTRVAEAVGIAGPGKVLGRLLPEGKAEAIEGFQRDGHSVAMVGDGINDTLALARADVGVAVPPPGATSAVMSAAADAADLVLLGNRLTQLVEAVHLARATMNRVRLNLAWALAYNCLAVPLAAGAFLPAYDIALTPTLAGGLMAGSSVLVVVSSLLLRLHKAPQ
ncbi:unnamed protein product [Closterium sp. Yama58-4]|nr:unnamed protein product [Closterium sp. Yama58-4]